MLKAAGGGGGRGMRAVEKAEEMTGAFARCQSEALAAFGDRSVFVEKLLTRPRHIEVQVLGDSNGNLVHLYERDCSVQLRNQKVVEIAPAPALEEGHRQRILEDAIRLMRAAGYVNAGTVEFLVLPERGEHFFIECNPRVQVEHTVTEQITGIDLVEAQFRIAADESLNALGIPDQTAVETRGFAVQARIVAGGSGVLTAYKEPTGPGVRIDSCAYLGYAPPPQFDPMFAKLICQSNSTHSLALALDRAVRALGEFHIAGVPANLGQLHAILSHPAVRSGDARTTFFSDYPDLNPRARASGSSNGSLALLEQQAVALRSGKQALPVSIAQSASAGLAVPNGAQGIESPMTGTVIEVPVEVGATVDAGATLMVVSAMKMETAITATCGGVVTGMVPAEAGASVTAGQIVATIAPTMVNANGVAPRQSATTPGRH
jgi:pyruvate carboxylase